jgi:hypothetical protein
MAAIEAGLRHGPVHLFKHNKPSAVGLSAGEYARLSEHHRTPVKGLSALQWLLAHHSTGTKSKRAIDQLLRKERDSWK